MEDTVVEIKRRKSDMCIFDWTMKYRGNTYGSKIGLAGTTGMSSSDIERFIRVRAEKIAGETKRMIDNNEDVSSLLIK